MIDNESTTDEVLDFLSLEGYMKTLIDNLKKDKAMSVATLYGQLPTGVHPHASHKFNRAVRLNPPSGYELLHGVPKTSEMKIKYSIEFRDVEPLQRKGWDHVQAQYSGWGWSYCSGDWLVSHTGKCWMIYHPKKTKLSNLDFSSEVQAMAWIEENFLCTQ